MNAHDVKEREALILRRAREADKWSAYVDTLLRAFRGEGPAPPSLGSKIEALRHKRDCVMTKVEALKRHKRSGWTRAKEELDDATRELRDSWRSVIGTLDRESLFV